MNVIYPAAKNRMLTGDFNWTVDSVAIALYDVVADYDPDHEVIGDVAGTQVAAGTPLTGKQVDIDLLIADPTTYYALTSPLEVHSAVMYRVTDGALVAFMDDIVGFSLLPVGADYVLTPSGPNGAFFRL